MFSCDRHGGWPPVRGAWWDRWPFILTMDTERLLLPNYPSDSNQIIGIGQNGNEALSGCARLLDSSP